MATLDLGKIKQVWQGTYNNGTAYVVDDLVAYTDSGILSTYICVANSTGNAPSSSGTAHASWNYVSKGVADPIPSQSGNSGKVLKTDGSSISWGTDVGGKILQIVGAVDQSNTTSTSSSSYVDTTLNCNITTSASGHAGVYVMVSGMLGGQSHGAGGETISQMQLVRTPSGGSSTALHQTGQGGWGGNQGGQTIQDYSNTSMLYYDTGTSTSTTYTYKLMYRKRSDTSIAQWNLYNGYSSIYLFEIGS